MQQENPKGQIWSPLVQVDLELHEVLGRLEGFEQLVGYKPEIYEKQGFLHQFSQTFEGSTKESQEEMTLTYQDLISMFFKSDFDLEFNNNFSKLVSNTKY